MNNRVGVMVVTLSEDRQKILLHRREFYWLWDLPGGGIDLNETPTDAAMRETREETGYEVEVEKWIGVYRHPSVYSFGDQVTNLFLARVVGGKANQFGLETMGLGWFAPQELPRDLEPIHKQMILDALSDARTPFNRVIKFAAWKLFLARIGFFMMRWRNYLLRRTYKIITTKTTKNTKE
ncbi:MAG: NUDIX domain-containing protein [Chloroflexi bacterium]|nr:NUDIX domain-containing protein [Chloroflexota bacterium]